MYYTIEAVLFGAFGRFNPVESGKLIYYPDRE